MLSTSLPNTFLSYLQALSLREPRLTAPVIGKASTEAQEVQADADDGTLQAAGMEEWNS
jgi:hypothetical protein